MNIGISKSEEEYFSVEDVIVSYSNIEITHVNDNKAPVEIMAKKAIIWLLLASMIVGIFFI